MSRDSLEQLLCEADASARRPATRADLAGIIRHLDRRRRRTARVAGASAASLLLLLSVGLWLWNRGQAQAPPGDSLAQSGGERQSPPKSREELLARAARLEEQADRMSAALAAEPAGREVDRRIGRLQALLWELEAVSPLARREEEAAKILYLAAARLEQEFHDAPSALEAYQRVIRQFPRSVSAQVARRSLPRLEKAEGDRS